MFEETRVSNIFKASQGQITEVNLKDLSWPCLWKKGAYPGPAALLNSLLHNPMGLLAQNPIYISAFYLFPQGYNDAKSSHSQLTIYLLASFSLILIELRSFSHGF